MSFKVSKLPYTKKRDMLMLSGYANGRESCESIDLDQLKRNGYVIELPKGLDGVSLTFLDGFYDTFEDMWYKTIGIDEITLVSDNQHLQRKINRYHKQRVKYQNGI